MITFDKEKQKSVEKGWAELKSGLGEIVTEDDSFLEDLNAEIRPDKGPSPSVKR